MRNFSYLLLPVILYVFSSNPTGQQSKAPTSSYEISLTGKVLDKDGKPLANAVAVLNSRNLADTTGSEGVYNISVLKDVLSKQFSKAALKNESVVDSVIIFRDGQIITSIEISRLIETLPDVFIVQSGISGKLISADTTISFIQAVLTDKSSSDSTPKTVDLWYNEANSNYSGFVYFVYSAKECNYKI